MYHYPRLRHMREDSDTSQIQLAEYLKIDQRTYSNYETGKRGNTGAFIDPLSAILWGFA